MTSHVIRERLSAFRGLPFGRVMDLMATLPWTSLLALAQLPSAPPVVRRQAEKKLLYELPKLSLGEKVALARRAHRAILKSLIVHGDEQVLTALLDNPRLAENDILLILNTGQPPPGFFTALARHHRWGQYYGVRRGLAECKHTPLPLALSALVQLRMVDIRNVASRPDLSDAVRSAAKALKEKEEQGLRRVIRSSSNGLDGRIDAPESIR
jgi:hypothetical protein